MNEQRNTIRLEGIVHATRYDRSATGKQFLGAILKCSDRMEWVIDYEEQSPFHALVGRRVEVSGEPYDPDMGEGNEGASGEVQQHLVGNAGSEDPGQLRVSSMRLVEVAVDADLEEVGAKQRLRGRFEHRTSRFGPRDTRDAPLSFVSEEGDTFLVVNDPVGAVIGPSVQVVAYAVRPSPSIARPQEQYMWIICPCSARDLWKWRERDV